jgi:hypothetical protein
MSAFVLRQTPSQHWSEPAHVRPQAPQFEMVFRGVQTPPQHPSVAAHARAPAPEPQRHWSPLQVVPAGQDTVHGTVQRPPEHVWPVGHIMPHIPQLPAFVLVSTQPPPQQVSVPAQGPRAPQRQAPPTHVSPVRHAGVQPPVPVSTPGGLPSRPRPVS